MAKKTVENDQPGASEAAAAAAAGAIIGRILAVPLPIKNGPERPLIVTSVNQNGTVNGRFVLDPADNPARDGNFPTTAENVKL